jgi:hypothetical protein
MRISWLTTLHRIFCLLTIVLVSLGKANAFNNDPVEMYWEGVGNMMQRLGEKAEKYANAKAAVIAMDEKYTALYNECQQRQETCDNPCKDYSKIVFNYKYWRRARNFYRQSDQILQTTLGMRPDPLGQTMNMRNITSMVPDFNKPFYGTPEACERMEASYRQCLMSNMPECESLWQPYDECMKVETVNEAKKKIEAHVPLGYDSKQYVDADGLARRLEDMAKRSSIPGNANDVREKAKAFGDKYGYTVLHCGYTRKKQDSYGYEINNTYYFWLEDDYGKIEDMDWYQAIPMEYRDADPISYFANIDAGSPLEECPPFNDEAAKLKKLDASLLLAKECPASETVAVSTMAGGISSGGSGNGAGGTTATTGTSSGGAAGGNFLFVLITAGLSIAVGMIAAGSWLRSLHPRLAGAVDAVSPMANTLGMIALVWGLLMILWSVVNWSFLSDLLPYLALLLGGFTIARPVLSGLLQRQQVATEEGEKALPDWADKIQTVLQANTVITGIICLALGLVHLVAGYFVGFI